MHWRVVVVIVCVYLSVTELAATYLVCEYKVQCCKECYKGMYCLHSCIVCMYCLHHLLTKLTFVWLVVA